MYDITYLSTQDRETLIILTEELPLATGDLQAKISKKIREIQNRSKPLSKCTLDDCNDFQSQIYKQIEHAQRAGKPAIIRNLYQILEMIMERMQTSTIIMSKQRAADFNEINKESRIKRLSEILGTKVNGDSKKGRTIATGTSKSSNSWSVDFGSND